MKDTSKHLPVYETIKDEEGKMQMHRLTSLMLIIALIALLVSFQGQNPTRLGEPFQTITTLPLTEATLQSALPPAAMPRDCDGVTSLGGAIPSGYM